MCLLPVHTSTSLLTINHNLNQYSILGPLSSPIIPTFTLTHRENITIQFIPYLFPTIRWKVEYKHCEKRNAHAGNDQVDCVEQCFSSHCDIEGDVKVGFVTACVDFHISENF